MCLLGIPTYDSLYNDHWNEKLSSSEMALKYGVHVQTIKRWIKTLEVPMRNKSDAAVLWMGKKRKRKEKVKKEVKEQPYKNYDVLYRDYWMENLSTKEIADKYGMKKASIQYWLNKHNINKRDTSSSMYLASKKSKRVYVKNKVIANCAWCNKEMLVWPYRLRKSKFLYCSKECKSSHWHENFTGEKAFNWKGGHWTENADKRHTFQYQKIRDEIRNRDNWTCHLCGSKSNIIVHHIITVKEDSSKIFDKNNLISPCDDCHRNKVNGHEKDYEKLFTDIIAKTVNCWNPLKPLCHNTTGNGECDG